MKMLLEHNFTTYHHKKAGIVSTDCRQQQGNIVLNDDKACDPECPVFFKSHCLRDTFQIHSNSSINIINIEAFLNKFTKIKGKRCDFLLYDINKIVFADVTCTMEHFLYTHLRNGVFEQGKRNVARLQIKHTIELLQAEPSIKTYIERKKIKIGILAYRIKDEDLFQNVPRRLSKELEAWISMEKAIERKNLSFSMPYGFVFKTIKYPSIYSW